jgi:hypothetical protein
MDACLISKPGIVGGGISDEGWAVIGFSVGDCQQAGADAGLLMSMCG